MICLPIVVFLAGCGEILSGGSSAPSVSEPLTIDDLIGTLSLTTSFSGASDEFEDVVTFSNADIVVNADGVRILQIREGNLTTVCQHLADVNMFQCSVAESTPTGDSSLVSYDYTGGRSGRGWAPTGTITLERGLFGTTVDDRVNGIAEWSFSWSDRRETFSVDSTRGIILRLGVVLGESGEIGSSTICVATTFDPTRPCTNNESAPWVQVRSNYAWDASTVGSGSGGADHTVGLWSPARQTEAEINVTSYLFSLNSASTGSGVFEFCTAQTSTFIDPVAIANECTRGLIEEPDGDVSVGLEGNTELATQRLIQTRRLVAGYPVEGDGINDYKVVYDQATGDSVGSPLAEVSPYDVKRIADVISGSIQQSLMLR